MAPKLNGWQRLWVVISIIYLAPVVAYSVSTLPTRSDIDNSRVYDAITAVGAHREKVEGNFKFDGAYKLREQYSDLSNDEIIKGLEEKWARYVDFVKLEKNYKEKIAALPFERTKHLGIAFLVWLIPVVAVYVVGLAIAWVLKGFMKKPA